MTDRPIRKMADVTVDQFNIVNRILNLVRTHTEATRFFNFALARIDQPADQVFVAWMAAHPQGGVRA